MTSQSEYQTELRFLETLINESAHHVFTVERDERESHDTQILADALHGKKLSDVRADSLLQIYSQLLQLSYEDFFALLPYLLRLHLQNPTRYLPLFNSVCWKIGVILEREPDLSKYLTSVKKMLPALQKATALALTLTQESGNSVDHDFYSEYGELFTELSKNAS